MKRGEMTLEERYFALKNDPARLARLFKFAWIAAYAMLILGSALIIWALLDSRF